LEKMGLITSRRRHNQTNVYTVRKSRIGLPQSIPETKPPEPGVDHSSPNSPATGLDYQPDRIGLQGGLDWTLAATGLDCKGGVIGLPQSTFGSKPIGSKPIGYTPEGNKPEGSPEEKQPGVGFGFDLAQAQGGERSEGDVP